MRKLAVPVAALVIVAAWFVAQRPSPSVGAADPDPRLQAGGSLPAGWSARADRDAPLDAVQVVQTEEGIDVTLGPAIILYRAADRASGSFRFSAKLTQTQAPNQREAYGLLIGGRDLDGPDQAYSYFLVRGDGKYLIKRRQGSQTTTLTRWTDHPAVAVPDETGVATNVLAISVAGGRCSFIVNDTEVASLAVDELEAEGIVGFRVNHNLGVRVSDVSLSDGPM